jgi:hypothetical protein
MGESDPDNPSEVLLMDTETEYLTEEDPGQLQPGVTIQDYSERGQNK